MTIHSILICGGTHGNELSGVYAVRQWKQNSQKLQQLAPSANISFELVNKASVDARTRFIDEDLNRQFDLRKLQAKRAEDGSSHEATLAQSLNEQYGPKPHGNIDLIVDIHNTTSAMGPTLIVLENDHFNQQLARYVKTHMPDAVILVEDHIPYEQHPYFCTLGKRSVMVEVGPQAQGALRADIYLQTLRMTELIVAFIETVNTNTDEQLPPVEAYRLIAEIPYPTDSLGQRSAMNHPNIDGNDFTEVRAGMPCFMDFEGKDILWEGDTVYPHFVGEAAYDKQNLAFATAQKCEF
ncbi:aspartoacylase [Glaciecola siphonariae]|uniref:Aspartoacylase n=1 Tax=Glaciecola siphonariae TaxID=521012 RepID=A0ABV9LUT4_9ALTE